MQGLITLKLGSSLLSYRQEYVSSQAALDADPRTGTQSAKFKSFSIRWPSVFDHELTLNDAQTTAQSLIWYADGMIDGTVERLEGTVLLICGNDKQSALYQRYFGKKTPSQLIKPILGDELETVRTFVPGLLSATDARLKDLGTELQGLVAQADAALEARNLADAAMADFRATGDRKQFVDEFNALRTSVYGELAEMPHAHPEWNLPSSFARSFFRNSKALSRGKTTATTADLDVQIAEVQEQLIALQQERAAAAALEQKQSEVAAELASNETALEEAQAQLANLRDKIVRLQGKVQK